MLLKTIKFFKKNKRLPIFGEIKRYFRIKQPKMPMPFFIQLEPTTKCNFDCVMCTRSTFSPERLNKDLSLIEFKKILQEIPSIRRIKLQGIGEPFLNKYLEEILQYGKQKNISFDTVTNGSLLHKKINLIPYFDSVTISLDSTDKKIFEKIRRHSNYDLIINNLKKITFLRKQKRWQTKIRISTVITHLNYHNIRKIIDLAIELDLDEVGFVEIENWTVERESTYVFEKQFINQERKLSSAINKDIIQLKKEYSSIIKIDLLPSDPRKNHCLWPFYHVYITVDGYITPCCIRANPQIFNFGNIFRDNFKKIWDGNKYQNFRKSLMLNTYNPICDNCPD